MPVHGIQLQPSCVILLCSILICETVQADVGTGITFLKLKGKPTLSSITLGKSVSDQM